ncbi:MAG TPA: hypothetical protein ENG87_03630 [Candidatus Pacearchaeota archaeon]|nr:hypothetical protein [Candidatus Pacearchaeota archaeon]
MYYSENLSEIITKSQNVVKGKYYTLTFSHGRFYEWHSSDWVLENMRKYLKDVVSIIKLSRPLFSNRYVISVIPKTKMSLQHLLDNFDYAWKKMGYSDVIFITAETDIGSSQPGGAIELLKETGEIVGTTASEILSPIKYYLAAGLVGLVTLSFLMRKR